MPKPTLIALAGLLFVVPVAMADRQKVIPPGSSLPLAQQIRETKVSEFVRHLGNLKLQLVRARVSGDFDELNVVAAQVREIETELLELEFDEMFAKLEAVIESTSPDEEAMRALVRERHDLLLRKNIRQRRIADRHKKVLREFEEARSGG